MIEVSDRISINEGEIVLDFVRSSGPGGQNVNKVSSAVQLRFNVQGSPSLPEDVRERLLRIAGKRITGDGWLVIKAQQYRTQEQNRADAIERLVALIRRAAEKPKHRRPTRPTLESRRRRIESKRRRSEVKRQRLRWKPDETG
jgi:ribosome-associated protein